jgi:hypothetical protein
MDEQAPGGQEVTQAETTYGCTLWPLVPDCLPECWSPDPTQWTPLQRWAVEASAAVLRRLTAGIYNFCPITIRPCRRNCPPEQYRYLSDPNGLPWVPAMLDGKIYNLTCGVCRGECGCGPISEMILDPPAQAVIEVKVDGVVLAPSAYRVDDYRRLVRLDGGKWPDCQQLDKPDTEPGTFSVSYWSGNIPDPGASFALTDLAVEWWKACQGKQCSLGENVRQVARQGITYDVDTVYESIREGRTGLKRVDLWIFSVNPHGLRRRLRVYSPDMVTNRRTTSPTGPIPPGPVNPGPLGVMWIFGTPQPVWLIPHGLGFQPAGVQITDLSGHEVRGEVTYPDVNTIRIEFAQPTAGRVRLS